MPLHRIPATPGQEEIAHRTACAAVNRSYVKTGDAWVPSDGKGRRISRR
jgi:hypothetical protein